MDRSVRPRTSDVTSRSGAAAGEVSARMAAAHADARRLIETAGSAAEVAGLDPRDPRVARRVVDAAVAAVSAHLCAMRTTVYPAARRQDPAARTTVAELDAGAREMASVMRGLEQHLGGDTHRPPESVADLRTDLAILFDVHVRLEEEMLARLEAAWPEGESHRRMLKIERAMRHAPTRPHPHLPRSWAMLSPAVSVSAHWDHVLDTLDARAVAGRPIRQPGPPGLWGWWLLGRPTGPEPAATDPAVPGFTAVPGFMAGPVAGPVPTAGPDRAAGSGLTP